MAGTVARGTLKEDSHYYTGMEGDSVFTDEFPFEVTLPVLERGRERYNIYCSVCHDRVGNGPRQWWCSAASSSRRRTMTSA